MIIDKRVDQYFRKEYHLKGKQVNSMRGTFLYQLKVLGYQLTDIWEFFKSQLKTK
jgi:hypothetical protein